MEKTLSKKATEDLRIILSKSYGEDFGVSLSDEEVNEIGDLLINILAEGLKMRVNITNPELQTSKLSTIQG